MADNVTHGLQLIKPKVIDLLYQDRVAIMANVQLADQKSAFIAIFHGVIIAGIGTLLQSKEIFDKIRSGDAINSACFAAVLAFLAVSFVANALVFSPRLRRIIDNDNSFLELDKAEVVKYVEAMFTETEATRSVRIVAQLQSLSRIVRRKFRLVGLALWTGVPAVLFLLFLLARIVLLT